MKKIFLFILYLLFLTNCAKKEEKKVKTETAKMSVKTSHVKKSDIKEIISLSGDIHGYNEVKIYAKVAGKLSKKIKQEGEEVKQDEVIALINRDEEVLKFSDAEVKSPIDGIITMYFIGLGDAVFPAQPMPREPVASVANIDKVKVIVYVSEDNISKINKGQNADIYVDAYPNKVFKGIVKETAAALHPLSRKLKVEIEVENLQHLLKPGMFAKVDIITKLHSNVLTVPKIAVLESKEVFIIKNGFAKKVSVKTGASDGEKIEIKEGLKIGQEVVTEGNYNLSDDTPVEIIK